LPKAGLDVGERAVPAPLTHELGCTELGFADVDVDDVYE
jgi:hypothetical protein